MNAMEFFTNNLLPVGISLMVLWVAYRLLFTNSNRFQFNRFYLLTAMLFSLALPLFGLLMGHSSPQVVALKKSVFNGFMMDEITITYGDGGQAAATPSETSGIAETATMHISLWQVLGVIYLIGVAVTALLFLFKMGKLIAMIIRSPKRKMDGYTMVFTHKEHGPYSFFRYAFFTDEKVNPDIIRHELSHISHHHSWDILMVELMKIFQWFNPFIYLYKRELQSLHEYTADQDVVANGVDKRNYMMLILQQCTAVDFSDMSNNFSLILTKKRIKMITRNEKARRLWWRLLATIPVLAVLLVANTKVTAQEQKAEDLTKDVFYNEDGSYTKFESSDAPDPITGEMRKKTNISFYRADGTQANNFNIREVEKHNDTMMYTIDPFTISFDQFNRIKITTDEDINVRVKHQSNDSIYNIVEQMPEFTGGMEAMMKYLSGNIKYPEEAKDKGVSGRVFISFVIEKDGSVSSAKVMKGIGGGCDEEALRVVNAMPSWKPGLQKGKPVRVSYMLPINFKLDPKDESSEEKVEKELQKQQKPDKDGVWSIAETMPEFPGGVYRLRDYIQENLTVPEKYKEMDAKAEYRVFIQFVVAEDGSITNAELMKSEPSKKDLNDEALRVVKAMPKWKPGTVDGKPVKVKYILPVTYRLGK